MNIQEDYVSFKTAKLLKEKGFDEEVTSFYFLNGTLSHGNTYAYCKMAVSSNSDLILAPTLQMALKWINEKHGIFIQICIIPHYTITMEQEYYFIKLYINRRWKSFQELDEMRFATPEQACESAIKYCLENLI